MMPASILCTSQLLLSCLFFSPGDLEHWDENDSDLDADFPSDVSPHQLLACEEPDAYLTQDQHAVIWWVVAFSCIFQTLHSVSSRGVAWLLKFLGRHSSQLA